MSNEDGRVQVRLDGEICNHEALRAEFVQRGHRFATDHSDAEVIVRGDEERGDALVDRRRGMFAFVVVDLEAVVAALSRGVAPRLERQPVGAGARLPLVTSPFATRLASREGEAGARRVRAVNGVLACRTSGEGEG